MIDFIKIHDLPVDVENLLNNERLTFPLSNVATTGEVLNRWQPAKYRGLTFKVKGNNARLQFSPHKYFEGGETNFRDFNINNIQDVISEISTVYGFDPQKSFINFIEIGVNVELNVDPNNLINCFVNYRNNPFDRLKTNGKGYGRVCETQQFEIKAYNKGLQNGLNYQLLRFEVKVKKMKFLERYGIHSLTLADLTTPDVYPKFTAMLLDVLNRILIYNPEISPDNFSNPKDRELFIVGRYAEHWQKLENTKRHRQTKRFAELAESDKIKQELHQLISEKCNELTTCNHNSAQAKTQQNNHFNETVEMEDLQQNNLSINGYNVALCIVTGLPMYNQQPGTKYLSSKGVKWYYENEPEIYKNILSPVLTKKWLQKNIDKPNEFYFIEIAHQLRNKDQNPTNNPRNNTKKSYRNIESKGLKLWPMIETVDQEKLKLIYT
jgi:hypothetical protein